MHWQNCLIWGENHWRLAYRGHVLGVRCRDIPPPPMAGRWRSVRREVQLHHLSTRREARAPIELDALLARPQGEELQLLLTCLLYRRREQPGAYALVTEVRLDVNVRD